MDTKERVALMGKIVTVHQELERQYEKRRRYWEPKDVEPRAGWVTGFRTLQNGLYSSYTDEPPSLAVTETVPCVLVAYWTSYNPVKVPLDGFELGGEPHPTEPCNIEMLKKWLKEDSKNWPRDEKGRWIG